MRFFGIGFLVLLFLEIMSIVWVADWLGGGWTLFLMAATFAAGVLMLRHTGLSGLLLAGAAMRSGGRVSVYQMLCYPLYGGGGVSDESGIRILGVGGIAAAAV